MLQHLIPISLRKALHRAGVERVYFIRDIVTGYIKIGRAVNPTKRLKSLQTGNPNKLVIIATITPRVGETSKGVEDELHSRFSSSRVSGEWFHPTKELMEYINETSNSS